MSDGPQSRSLTGKLVRFGIVGLANTAIDLAVFATLFHAGAPALLANLGAWTAAVLFSFVANAAWSFERGRPIAQAFLRFVSLGALISLGVSNLAILGLADRIGVWPAKVLGVVAAAILNFIAARWSIEGRARR